MQLPSTVVRNLRRHLKSVSPELHEEVALRQRGAQRLGLVLLLLAEGPHAPAARCVRFHHRAVRIGRVEASPYPRNPDTRGRK